MSNTIEERLEKTEGKLNDTGWVDISSYLNTTYFGIRTGYEPKMRKIGNILYFTGEVYIKTALSNANDTQVFSNLPYSCGLQQNGTGLTYSEHRPYALWIQGAQIKVSTTIGNTQNEYTGFNLSNLNGACAA